MTTAMNACVALHRKATGYDFDPTTQSAFNGATQQRNRYFLHEKYATPYTVNHGRDRDAAHADGGLCRHLERFKGLAPTSNRPKSVWINPLIEEIANQEGIIPGPLNASSLVSQIHDMFRPERAITEGLVSRFGEVDPTDQGAAERANLSAEISRRSVSGD